MELSELNQPKEVIEFLEKYIKNPEGYVLFSGRNGTGKSFCALQVYYKFTPFELPAFNDDRAIFTTQADLNIKWSQTMAKDGNIFNLLELLCKTPFLVLDDIGTRVPTEAFMDFLYAIADKRYTNRKKLGTLITTNLSSSVMRSQFGDAFVSRVASGKCFRFEGEDRRFNEF